ncbi:hypothetical protein DI392_11420 [Vibrio albus]|uniref:Recombinase domain-containing protein n=1 Tax=Vibrio albus TaxID=2200953 RepID=A0A2U3B9K0_9VIBR|nr:YlcI/YnfO family protein [Vibrio albus]PWI33447.1 hypothetical protein DI392_11420 [Vibrio albus]
MKKIVVVLNSNTNRQSAKKNIRFEHELLAAIEEIRPEETSFSQWVKDACKEKLNRVHGVSESCAQFPNTQDSDVYTSNHTCVRTQTPEIERSAVELAIEWHEQGMFHQQIADRLNQMGKLSPDGKRWTRLLIRQFVNQD